MKEKTVSYIRYVTRARLRTEGQEQKSICEEGTLLLKFEE